MDDEYLGRHLDDLLRLAGRKANQLAGNFGFVRDERDDLQQILIVECLRRQPRFQPRRGNRAAFNAVIIAHVVATLIAAQKAQRRDYRRCHRSLNSPSNIADPSSPELAEVISEEHYQRRIGRTLRAVDDALHLRHDVQRAIAALPPDLRQICRLLMALDGIALVAHAAGISRATLHRRMSAVREAFGSAHLADYLP